MFLLYVNNPLLIRVKAYLHVFFFKQTETTFCKLIQLMHILIITFPSMSRSIRLIIKRADIIKLTIRDVKLN